MDFSAKFDELQKLLADARASAEAAVTESRDQIKQRIDEAQQSLDEATAETQQDAGEAEAKPRSKWAKLKADAATHRSDIKAKFEQGSRELDADVAAEEADWTEGDAISALDFAGWAINNARLDVLAAIESRSYADEHAT
jgi:hypothetical protein